MIVNHIARALTGAALLMLSGCASTGSSDVGLGTKLACNLTPAMDTYECFEGRYEDQVAASPEEIGKAPPNVQPNRPPKSLYFAGGPGSETAPEMKAGMIVQNEILETYLNELLQKIVANAPKPYPPMTAHVLADFNYSAEATADGDIYVNLGLLETAASEGELAAVMAHEASHIILGHHERLELFETQKKLADGAVSAVAIASSLKQGQNSGTFSLEQGANTRETQTAFAVASAVTFVASDVISSSWGREQEDQADLLGADMMVRAGYNPEPGATALERIASDISTAKQREEEANNSTASLEQSLAANPSLAGFTQGMTSALGSALSGALKGVRDFFRREHLSPERRRAAYLAYVDREHSEALFFDVPEKEPLLEVKRKAKFDDLLKAYEKVVAARNALGKGDLGEAESAINEALRNRAVAKDPVPRVVQAQIMFARGDARGAVRALDRVKDRTLTPDGYYLWSDALLATGDSAGALNILQTAEQTYGVGLFADQRIKLALTQNDETGARAQYDACLKQEGAVKERCRAVWKQRYPNDPTVSGPLAGEGAQPDEGGLLGSVLGGGSSPSSGGSSPSSGSGNPLDSLGSLFGN